MGFVRRSKSASIRSLITIFLGTNLLFMVWLALPSNNKNDGGNTLANVKGEEHAPQPASFQLSRSATLKKNKYAYVFFATSNVHACGVLTLVDRIRSLPSRPNIDFVVIVLNVNEKHLERLRKSGISAREPTVNALVKNNHFRYAILKLEPFKMTEYERIIHMDVDSWIEKSIDHLFDLPMVDLAAPVANWENELCFSGALLVMHPSMRIWHQRIEPHIEAYASKAMSEMNLLNEVWEHRIGSNRILPEVLILPCSYMTLSTELTNPEPYHHSQSLLLETTHIFHFSGGFGKPWAPNNVSGMNEPTKQLFKRYQRTYARVCS